MARATAYSSPGFQYTRLPHYLIMALYLRQNSSSHFNIRGRNVTYECLNILVCNPTFMFTIEHSSRQCNIPFDKVSDHNSYFQVCNSTCRMTIHRAKGWSKIRGDTFYQRRNNSSCDVTTQDVRWHINHQGSNSTCDVTIWACIVTMPHSTPQFNQQFNMLVGTRYWNGRRCSRPGTGPTQAYKKKDGRRDAFYSPKFLSFRLQCSWANSMRPA